MRLFVALLCLVGCSPAAHGQITSALFRHHYITREMPGRNMGMGTPALADFDKDGDLDFALFNRGDGLLHWFENDGADIWKRHRVGKAEIGQLGSLTMDVDGDGWTDIVIGGYWYRNPGQPRERPFVRYTYDSSIQREIHDMVLADVDGSGALDIVAMGDGDGCFWYRIPDEPTHDGNWPRTVITLAVRDENADILVVEQEDPKILPQGASPRWFLWENLGGAEFVERVVFEGDLGGHDVLVGDIDGDGDLDVAGKIWSPWNGNANGGKAHADWLENLTR